MIHDITGHKCIYIKLPCAWCRGEGVAHDFGLGGFEWKRLMHYKISFAIILGGHLFNYK